MPWSSSTLPPAFDFVTDESLRRDVADLMNAVLERELAEAGDDAERIERAEGLAIATGLRFARDRMGLDSASEGGERPPVPGAQMAAYLSATAPEQWDGVVALQDAVEIEGDIACTRWAALRTIGGEQPSRTRALWERDWVVGPFVEVARAAPTHWRGIDLDIQVADLEAMARNARAEFPLITLNKEHDKALGAFGVLDPSTFYVAGGSLFAQTLMAADFFEEFRAGRWLGSSAEFPLKVERRNGKTTGRPGSARSKRPGGGAIGPVLTGLAFTNSPQFHDIRTRPDAQLSLLDDEGGNHNVDGINIGSVSPDHSPEGGPTMAATAKNTPNDITVKLSALTGRLELAADADEAAALAALDAKLKAGDDAEAKLSTTEAENAELKTRLEAAVKEREALSADKSDVEKRVAKLSADLEETKASVDAVKAQAEKDKSDAARERAELQANHDVEALCHEGYIDKGEMPKWLKKRTLADKDELGREVYDAEVAELKAAGPKYDTLRGANARGEGDPAPDDPETAWLSFCDQQDGDTLYDKEHAALATEEGQRLFSAYQDSRTQVLGAT
jgi:hypothetical protein